VVVRQPAHGHERSTDPRACQEEDTHGQAKRASRLVLVPERRTAVVVLANSNTVPTSTIAAAALDTPWLMSPSR
jgi:hypothetical protein